LDKYFLLYSHYIFWNVMVLLLEYVFSVLFPPLVVRSITPAIIQHSPPVTSVTSQQTPASPANPPGAFRRATVTYRVCVSVGRPDAAGAWSSPMLEQLTTHKFWGPTAVHEQFPGHGLHAPPSAVTPERASRQKSAKSRLEN